MPPKVERRAGIGIRELASCVLCQLDDADERERRRE